MTDHTTAPDATACEVDRAGFVNRLHEWAVRQPEMGRRVDALIAAAEHVPRTSDGTGAHLKRAPSVARSSGEPRP